MTDSQNSTETFVLIQGYPNYEISNFARIRNLKKSTVHQANEIFYLENEDGRKMFSVNRLVAKHFLPEFNEEDYVINIDGNRKNNNVSNLKMESVRQATIRGLKNKSSKYTGVSFVKAKGKFYSYVVVGGKKYSLGFYDNEDVAAQVYNDRAYKEFGDRAVLNVISCN